MPKSAIPYVGLIEDLMMPTQGIKITMGEYYGKSTKHGWRTNGR